MFPYLLVSVLLGSCYCSKEGSMTLGRPELFGPSVALLNDVGVFNCHLTTYPKNETILLELFKEGNRNKLPGFYTSSDGQAASFPIVIQTFHEGNLECVARAQNNSLLEPSVSYTHNLKVIEPVAGAKVNIQSGAAEFFEGRTLELRCTLTAGNYVSYKWLVNGQPVLQSPRHNVANDQLIINRTTSANSGLYMCVATNSYNTTRGFTSNSSEVEITVKDVVSNPDISFNVMKKESNDYFAVVTCQSTRGTLPITFSLYNKTELAFSMTAEERKVKFKVPLVLDRHLTLQCQANNSDEVAYSRWLPLQVGRFVGQGTACTTTARPTISLHSSLLNSSTARQQRELIHGSSGSSIKLFSKIEESFTTWSISHQTSPSCCCLSGAAVQGRTIVKWLISLTTPLPSAAISNT
ncbi:contactin-5 isoform 3-T3 [Syngnathus typhle]